MRLDELSVELRPRTPWEAVELGTALVRSHAGAIWRPWLALTFAVFAVINAVLWPLDALWLAPFVLWWLKPLFDRIPLYVISRAVFGPAPKPRETLRATHGWGLKTMAGHLLWRRLSPVRSLNLPIDLLEGGDRAAERRRVVGGGVRGTAALVTLVCANFEAVLVFAAYVLAMLFVPVELFSEAMRAAWELLSQDPPRWVQLLGNLVLWAAMSVIEPFYVGAGFGLYLDRRTRIEAWDVEIAFRRLGARLRKASVLLLCVVMLALSAPTLAQDASPPGDDDAPEPAQVQAQPAPKLSDVFGTVDDDPGFVDAARRAAQDPQLNPTQTVTEWVPNKLGEISSQATPEWLLNLAKELSKIIGLIAEYGLWILVAALVVVLVLTRRSWLPWLRDLRVPRIDRPSPIEREAQVEAEPLPLDVMARARALWTQGQSRQALSLLYRASVAAMTDQTGALLVPGATESECLRASRALADAEDRAAFARMVRIWQYAAYAERLPGAEDFESLLVLLGRRFGWAA